VWRAGPDGSNAMQLTSGAQDSTWPHFTHDGKSLLYQHADSNGRTTIWKTSVNGGPATQLTKALTSHAVASPADGKIAAWYSETADNQHWKLAIFAPEGGEPLTIFDAGMPISPESQLAWTPSGDGITFLGVRNGVFNLWMQPVDGRAPKALTSFTSGQIYSFDWSRDGRLAFSHGVTTSDVVLVRDSVPGRR
jgi:Tol biopolymer transport system component